MRDPFTWAVPFGRIFGITVRVHILFFIFVLVMWLKKVTDAKAQDGEAAAMLVLMALLFFSVLLHEFGHFSPPAAWTAKPPTCCSGPWADWPNAMSPTLRGPILSPPPADRWSIYSCAWWPVRC